MGFTHFDENGKAIMVDISGKKETERIAVAQGEIKVTPQIMQAVINKDMAKGDVLEVARLAGIMATKRTSDIIPLCHTIALTNVKVAFEIEQEHNIIRCICTAKTTGKTGVEMEALTGASATMLTVYDMCKALDKGMEIGGIYLINKSGGKSGNYIKKD